MLPDLFPTHTLSRLDRLKVEAFYRRFVEEYYAQYQFGHFLLAAYASVPALLTSDLLYKIWQNFHAYQWAGGPVSIHRVAVSDVLLSPLCVERGHDLYEMHPEVRLAFREWLHRAATEDAGWQRAGVRHPDQVAAFVYEYEQQTNPGAWRWGEPYQFAQHITALAHLAPAEAQAVLLEKLRSTRDETELVRLLNRIATLDRQFDAEYRSVDSRELPQFRQLAQFAEAWKALIQQHDAGFLRRLREMPELQQYLSPTNDDGTGLEVQIPEATLTAMADLPKPAFHAVLIGINDYNDTRIPSLRGCDKDVAMVSALLDQWQLTHPEYDWQRYRRLETLSEITQFLGDRSLLKDGDVLFFHYSGRDLYNSRGRILAAKDSVMEGENSTGLYQQDLEAICHTVIAEKRVHIVAVIDSCYNITPEQYNTMIQNPLRTYTGPLKGSLVILHATQVGQMAYEQFTPDDKTSLGGALSRNLSEIVPTHTDLDYQTLHAKLVERLDTNATIPERQRPLLEAFPSAAALYGVLSGKPGSQVYRIAFHAESSTWRLNAGFKQGITPSAGFFPTLLKSSAGEEWKVLRVEEEWGEVELIAGPSTSADPAVVFEVVVLQKAPFKVRVALYTGKSRSQLEKAFENQLVETDYYYPVAPEETAEIRVAYFNGEGSPEFYLSDTNPRSSEEKEGQIGVSSGSVETILAHLAVVSRYQFLQRIEGKVAGVLELANIQVRTTYTDRPPETSKLESAQQSPIHLNPIQFGLEDWQSFDFLRIDVDYSGAVPKEARPTVLIFDNTRFSVKKCDADKVKVYHPTSSQGRWVFSIQLKKSDLQLVESGEIQVLFSSQPLDLGSWEQRGISELAATQLDFAPYPNNPSFSKSSRPSSPKSVYANFRLGTWDTIRVPIKIAREESQQTSDPAKSTAPIAPASPQIRPLSAVLWVDDHPENNTIERGTLQSMGVLVTTVLDTEQGLAQLQSTQYQAIVSDLARDGDDRAGFTLLDQVRTRSTVPYFFYAGRNVERIREEALERGAQGCTNVATELVAMLEGVLREVSDADLILKYNKAIELNPNDATAFLNRAIFKTDLNQIEEAIFDYNKAIELDPSNSVAYTARGTAKSDWGQKAEAIKDFNKAIELNPSSHLAYTARGAAKADLGQKVEAIEDFNKAIELDSNNHINYAARGAMKSDVGQATAAIEDFDKAIELNPQNATFYYNRSIIKSRVGLTESARQDLVIAAKLDPKRYATALL